MTSWQWKSAKQSFKERSNASWIIGLDQDRWAQRVDERLKFLETQELTISRVMLFLSDPMEFLAAYMACAIAQCPVFLGNPAWKQQERQQAQAIAAPHMIWSDQGNEHFPNRKTNPAESGWIMIPTGGTSGQIKFAIHTWKTLSAAVKGMQDFFFADVPQPINSCCVLPLYHVSGLMQFMRSLLTSGTFAIIPFRIFQDGTSTNPEFEAFLSPQSHLPSDYFLSLVPTQLSRIINQGDAEQLHWLGQFRCILLGGAPASQTLLDQARRDNLNLAPTYGMTETGAQVMTLHPEKFLAGDLPPGEILPHVKLHLIATSTGAGQMEWSGPSLFLGYYPDADSSHRFQTDDIAEWDDRGRLWIKGRASRKIISGGENIYPEEVESVLIAMTDIEDACVFGAPDPDWGEIAIAAYVTANPTLSPEILTQRLKTTLAAYKCPKIWWPRTSIARNSQGKINMMQLQQDWENLQSEKL